MSISASQVKKARSCLRRWAFDWQVPFAEREPSGEAALLGEAVHLIGEDYHKRGKAPDFGSVAGAIFRPGMNFVPQPRVGRPEGEFSASIFGVVYKGFIDLECRAGDLPGVDPNLDIPAVVDYKSTKKVSDPAKVKNPPKGMIIGEGMFLDDPQALLYALKALIKTGADEVYLRWLYLRTEGKPLAVPCDARLSRNEVVQAFVKLVHPLATDLVQLKEKSKLGQLDPLTLPASPASCYQYGPKYPCPHVDKCNLSPLERLAGTIQEESTDMPSMLDNLKSQFPATATAVQVEPKGINPPIRSVQQSQAAQAVPEVPQAERIVGGGLGMERFVAPGSHQECTDEQLGKAFRLLASVLFNK